MLFQFNPRASVTMDMGGITTQPCINDKTHVMVLIIDATNVEVMPQNLVSQMKAMKEQANSKGICDMHMCILSLVKVR